ncbi:MAG TPA: NAD(P)/FAD-dependent oxidoreductase [Acidimicrobiales bacterium]
MDGHTHHPTRHRHDVAIVGTRAAGGPLAMLLARAGHDVVVLDRALLPSDTLSTHVLARTGVVQLHRWGLLDEVLADGAPAVREVTFHTPYGSRTLPVIDRSGVDLVMAPRRHSLDTIVARAAVDAGATLRLGVTALGVHRDSTGRVTGLRARGEHGEALDVAARIVVGADGLRSRVARAVDAPVVASRSTASGAAHYAYYAGGSWPAIEFFTADGSLAGAFPTNGGEVCIWACVPAEDALVGARKARGDGFEALLRRVAPALADRLRGSRRTSPVRGSVGLPNQVRQAWGPGWALVGDALHHRDPIAGHGISDAYRDADLLATALDAGLRGGRPLDEALEAYRREADEARRDIYDITCAMGELPTVDRFVELQRQMAAAVEASAAFLAARPMLPPRQLAVA